MPRPDNFDINKVIDDLRGTAQTLDSVLDSLYEMSWNDMTDKDYHDLDIEIFECTQCGWWCDQSENHEDKSGQWVCGDCKSDEEE